MFCVAAPFGNNCWSERFVKKIVEAAKVVMYSKIARQPQRRLGTLTVQNTKNAIEKFKKNKLQIKYCFRKSKNENARRANKNQQNGATIAKKNMSRSRSGDEKSR